MTLALSALVAFMALFVTDICWAIYVNQVKEHDKLRSACWSLALFLFGSVAVISYTTNHWLVIPAGAGAFFGTYTGVWWNKRKGVTA